MDPRILEAKIIARDIVSLSRAITLNESSLIADNILIDDILARNVDALDQSIVIGITGIPGVGKSTFIDVLGKYLHDQNLSLAIFSIDPTSELSHGSILGDKTRMIDLSSLENVFIRPSPSSNRLGGIGINTHKNIELAKIAGYDIILVETVGVGQSETTLKKLCDVFILLQMPSSGDELQGIKKGIMEIADFFIIHKADGDLKLAAENSKKEIESALHLTRNENINDRIFSFSSVEKTGLEIIWTTIKAFTDLLISEKRFIQNRREQRAYWIEEQFKHLLIQNCIEKNKTEIETTKSRTLNGQYIPISELIKKIR